MARSFEQQDDVQAWVDEVEQQIFNITAERSTSAVRLMKELTKSAMDDIERLYEHRGTIPGLSTGFRDLDKISSGLHPGNMVVIAGRPSMGKTALALNIAEYVAVEQQKPVGVFSLEMSAEELVKRLLCSRARVNLATIQNGFPRDTDHHALTATASQLMKCPLHIDDTASLTVNQVRSRARRMRLQFGIELLVIDYLQLMRAPSRRADSSRQAEVTDISAGIKALAKELSIPVIVLSQLNRQPEARDEGKPRLSDLRESGSIEQDADVVGLLVRPEVYEDDKEAREQKKGQATLIIAKQRNGPTGDVELTFLHEFTRFENASRVGDEDLPESERSEE
jgi:replicative DNA helicase